MKTILIITFLLVISIPGSCDEYIYDRHEKCIGRIDDSTGFVYSDRYGGERIGRVEKDGDIYNDSYGGKRIGRIKSDDRHDKHHDSRSGGAYFLLRESHDHHDREDY